MRFQFDERKSVSLRANPKRGVGFEEAQEVVLAAVGLAFKAIRGFLRRENGPGSRQISPVLRFAGRRFGQVPKPLGGESFGGNCAAVIGSTHGRLMLLAL
jgi:hypothetical protein